MRVLAFDTATSATTVALLDPDAGLEIEARDDPAPGARPGHVTRLLPLIAEVLERAGAGWEAVDRIAVGVGPGTFTGLRIGIATARALAVSREIPLLGVSTLKSLALNAAGEPGAGVVLTVLDARRGEAFAAAWRLGGEPRSGPGVLGERLIEPAALAPEALLQRLAALGPRPLTIGSGAIEFRARLQRAGADVPASGSELHRVTALRHCQLALGPGVADGAGDIRPEYLRLPDAELARRRKAAAAQT
jgi:tRNA threonylcarbamoyladenosine biosynthesis protein TsaB